MTDQSARRRMNGQPVGVCLVSAYDEPADARSALGPDWTQVPYRGRRILPTPERPEVHVFTGRTDEELDQAGWTRP